MLKIYHLEMDFLNWFLVLDQLDILKGELDNCVLVYIECRLEVRKDVHFARWPCKVKATLSSSTRAVTHKINDQFQSGTWQVSNWTLWTSCRNVNEANYIIVWQSLIDYTPLCHLPAYTCSDMTREQMTSWVSVLGVVSVCRSAIIVCSALNAF